MRLNTYTAFVALMALLVAFILTWMGKTRLDDYRAYHQAIAQSSTLGISDEIARFVDARQGLVAAFADEHVDLIRTVASDPENQTTYAQLEQRIAAYFPDYFAFTVTDANGVLWVEDFDGLIGEMCRRDIADFAETGQQSPRIHPHPDVYHFDILAPFGNESAEGMFFVSFDADVLGSLLSAAQAPGHQLMLLYSQGSDLIEVTADGARVKWIRDDYRLAAEERARIVHRTSVAGTSWEAADLHAPGLFERYRDKLVLQSVLIFIVTVAVSLVMLWYLRREEERRRAAERTKDQFLSVVSHELRTPITAIRGSLGLVAAEVTGALTAKSKELVSLALGNCERLLLLVNDILDMQKLEAGKMDFHFSPQPLGPLVAQSLDNNRGYADQLGASYTLRDSSSGALVNVDAHRFEQLLANLLSNAVKYGAEHDTVEITIEDRNEQVRVSVTDHGEGIPDAFRDSVFERFSQADVSSSRKVSGTGLGTNIVKLIAEAHGGTVGFTTEAGKGSTFYVDLPVCEADSSVGAA